MTPARLRAAHEWVSFADPDEERTWVFDVTFLLSRWGCIYGRGCQGILETPRPELDLGCCSFGAHFTDDDDVARVEAAARTLTAAQWQFRQRGTQRGVVKRNQDGEVFTRRHKGACIFLNRPGFEGGPGCALHRAAVERARPPMAFKPDVCWQLPLHREERESGDGHVVSTVGEWTRRDWGPGGEDFHWWCTEAPEAFGAGEPVYRSMRAELTAMAGKKVYRRLREYLDDKAEAGVALPHPTVRRRPG